ncbi:MAG: hypothetical protein A4S16_03235 [Proteobacteria bacterium SG_bin6]|nr:MAG: hypothetical protein A4S16_03235 [Proteobacteria bacterium SG_bin6]
MVAAGAAATTGAGVATAGFSMAGALTGAGVGFLIAGAATGAASITGGSAAGGRVPVGSATGVARMAAPCGVGFFTRAPGLRGAGLIGTPSFFGPLVAMATALLHLLRRDIG